MEHKLQAATRRLLKLAVATPLTIPLRRMALRRALPRAIWIRLPVPDRQFDVPVDAEQSYRYSAGEDDILARPLFWQGAAGPEPEAMPVFLDLAARTERVIDVGANTGTFTLACLARNPRATVVAFEALPRVASILAGNLELNGWTSRVAVRRAAAGAETGRAKFVDPERLTPTSARLVTAKYRDNSDGVATIDVPITRLDDDEAVRSSKVGLIKIDVEGAEDQVLGGSIDILTVDQPPVVFECHSEGPIDELNQIFDEVGYRIYWIGPNGPESISRIAPSDDRSYRNYLALHASRSWLG